MVKNKDGVQLTNQDEIEKIWKEHFLEVLNLPVPEDTGQVEEDDGIPDPEIVDAPKSETFEPLAHSCRSLSRFLWHEAARSISTPPGRDASKSQVAPPQFVRFPQ